MTPQPNNQPKPQRGPSFLYVDGLTASEKGRYLRAAARAKKTFTQWVVDELNRAVAQSDEGGEKSCNPKA